MSPAWLVTSCRRARPFRAASGSLGSTKIRTTGFPARSSGVTCMQGLVTISSFACGRGLWRYGCANAFGDRSDVKYWQPTTIN